MTRRVIAGLSAAVLALLGTAISPAEATQAETFGHGNVRIVYQPNKGTADVYWRGAKRISDFASAVSLPDRLVSTKDYRGGCRYRSLTVTCERHGLPTLKQKFIFDGPDHFFIQVELSSSKTLSTNQMIPFLVDLPADDGRLLR